MRIDALVTTWFDPAQIYPTLSTLMREPDLRVHVIDNASPHSPQLQAYERRLLAAGQIESAFFFDENITNQAPAVVLHNHLIPFSEPYLLVTDGDCYVEPGVPWLAECVAILDRHSHVGAVGPRYHLENLPEYIRNDPAYTWEPFLVCEDFETFPNGMNLILMRTGLLRQFMREWPYAYRDSQFRHFMMVHGYHWAQTRRAQFWHLSWSAYGRTRYGPATAYALEKTQHTHEALWYHQRFCPFTRLTAAGEVRFSAQGQAEPAPLKNA